MGRIKVDNISTIKRPYKTNNKRLIIIEKIILYTTFIGTIISLLKSFNII